MARLNEKEQRNRLQGWFDRNDLRVLLAAIASSGTSARAWTRTSRSGDQITVWPRLIETVLKGNVVQIGVDGDRLGQSLFIDLDGKGGAHVVYTGPRRDKLPEWRGDQVEHAFATMWIANVTLPSAIGKGSYVPNARALWCAARNWGMHQHCERGQRVMVGLGCDVNANPPVDNVQEAHRAAQTGQSAVLRQPPSPPAGDATVVEGPGWAPSAMIADASLETETVQLVETTWLERMAARQDFFGKVARWWLRVINEPIQP